MSSILAAVKVATTLVSILIVTISPPQSTISTTTDVEPQTETVAEQPAEVEPKQALPSPIKEAEPVKIVFDPDDPKTWPKCAADEIVRRDNGQCGKKAVPKPTPAPQQKQSTQTAPQRAPAASQGGFLVGCDNLRTKLAQHGLSAAEISAAINIATRESGCNQGAVNPSSGACNVFQELSCGKWGGRHNLAAHIRGADAYAKARYGGWVNAWADWQRKHWW